MPKQNPNLPASFRDPAGHLFTHQGKVRRQINPIYFEHYHQLINSGLYDTLTKEKYLIPHKTISEDNTQIIIEPEQLPFITYPYEWSFTFYKEAALLTLTIAQKALKHNLTLKDATAYNIQQYQGKPIFIDTLSFEKYQKDKPWNAYGQFCEHFLAPLLLMKYHGPDFNKILPTFINGIPLDLASKLLPFKTHLSPFIQSNIHLHAKSIKQSSTTQKSKQTVTLSKNKLESLLAYLKLGIENIELKNQSTEWQNYYNETNYSKQAFSNKEKIITQWITDIKAQKLWDAGGNNGHFLRLIADNKTLMLCTDIDPNAVNQNYQINKKTNIQTIYPLQIDLTNPSANIGYNNQERPSLTQRITNAKIDCTLALALMHHLCISNNWTFDMLFEYFKPLSPHLIIEFVPPEDSWAKTLLNNKREAKKQFNDYNQTNFEQSLKSHYTLIEKHSIPKSKRTLYLLKAT